MSAPTSRRRPLLLVLVLLVLLALGVAGLTGLVGRTGLGGGESERSTPAPTAPTPTAPTPTAPTPTEPAPTAPTPTATVDGDTFTLASFNVLGASHTGPTGKAAELASGVERIPATVELLARHGVDVVGLQEFQGSQFRAFRELAGSTYATYSDRDDTENAIAWSRDRFVLVSGRTFGVPYFQGRERRMPVVRLRDRVSDRELYVVNVHNPADTRQYARQAGNRTAAVEREVALLRRLARTGTPVLLTGDMNDKQGVFCALTAGGLMVAANGGQAEPRCRLPADAGIDWIFGHGDLRFEDYRVDRSPRRDGTSDHPIVVTRVRF